MTKRQKEYLKGCVEMFHSAGINYDTCAFLVAQQMLKLGVPVTLRNLELAFEDFK